MSIKEVTDKISWYQKQHYEALRDESINAVARDEKLARLARQMESYAPVVYSEFEAAWRNIRKEFAALDASRRQASQRAADSWSYDGMRYFRELARDDVGLSQSLQELEAHIKSINDTGSREQRRAYLESGGAVIAKYRGQVGVGSLVSWMEREAAKLTTPPEFAALDEKQHDLILSAIALRDNTVSTGNMLPQSGVVNLLRDVHIGMRADSASGNYVWSLDFAPEFRAVTA